MSRRRLIVTVIAGALYVAWGAWLGYAIAQPSDPSEDMSTLDPLFDGVLAFAYVVGLVLLIRYAKGGQLVRTAAVPVLIVPASLAAVLLTIFLIGGSR